MSYTLNNITALDDKNLAIHSWTIEESKGSILIIHGMAEHGLRYGRFADYANSRGWNVYVPDMRGHGATLSSNDTVGFISNSDGWSKMLSDVQSVYEFIENKKKERIFILGHSMGAIVVLNYLQEFGKKADGYILSALAQRQDLLSDISKALSRVQNLISGKESRAKLHNKMSFGIYNKAFKPNRTAFDWLSRDEVEVDKYISDPMCGEVFTSQFYYDISTGVRDIYRPENLKKLSPETNVCFLVGSMDQVAGGAKKIHETFDLLSSYMPKTTLKLYEDGRHEMLNEINRKDVFSDVINWIETIDHEKDN